MTNPKVLICPYCGGTQPAGDRCRACGGLFEPLSRQATHNAMGPWFVRDATRPFQPGCSYETLLKMIERGQVTKLSIVRGPTTRQFWTVAKRVPGVAHVLGYCHACDISVDPDDHGCHACGVPFGAYLDRNFLGLPEVRPLPWEAGFDLERADAEATAGRSGQWASPAPGVGISSFASDAELLGRQSGPHALGGGGGRRHGATEAHAPAADHETHAAHAYQPTALRGAHDSPLNGGSGSASSVSIRALRRTLARQQRTIRFLMVGLMLAVLGLVITVAVMKAAPGSGSGSGSVPSHSPGQSAPITRQESGEKAPSSPPGRLGVPGARHADESSPGAASPSSTKRQQPVEERKTPGAAPGAAPGTGPGPEPSLPPAKPPVPEPKVQTPVGEYVAEFERAQILISHGLQQDRPVNDRVRDLEEAIQVLQNIADKAPADQRPADLEKTIAGAQQELDHLRPPV